MMSVFIFMTGAAFGACISFLIIGAVRLPEYEDRFEEYEEDDEDEAVDW